MIEFLEYGFMQRAFLAGIIIAIMCSAIGVFLVLKRMSMLGDGLAHISFGGIAFGMFFNFYPMLSALVFSILSAIGMQKLKSMKVYGDAAIAIFFSFGLSLGVVLISASNGFNADLFSYLFGSILSVSNIDLIIISAIGGIAIFSIMVFYKELFAISFNEELAKSSGIKVENINLLLLVLASIAVVASMRIVGIILVSSFIVIPASIALLFSRSFKQTIFLSMAFAVFSLTVGLALSYYLDLAAGGAIVLVLVALFFLSLLYKNISAQLAGKHGKAKDRV